MDPTTALANIQEHDINNEKDTIDDGANLEPSNINQALTLRMNPSSTVNQTDSIAEFTEQAYCRGDEYLNPTELYDSVKSFAFQHGFSSVRVGMSLRCNRAYFNGSPAHRTNIIRKTTSIRCGCK